MSGHYVIELRLEDKVADEIRQLWVALKQAGVSTSMLDSGARPHVSLLVCRTLNIQAAKENLGQLSLYSNMEIKFSHLGFFPTNNSTNDYVGYIGVTPTKQLVALHHSVFASLQNEFEFIEPHYTPEEMIFHCTLALDLRKDDIKHFFEIVQSFKLAKYCACDAIDIVEYFPAQYKSSIVLNDHK